MFLVMQRKKLWNEFSTCIGRNHSASARFLLPMLLIAAMLSAGCAGGWTDAQTSGASGTENSATARTDGTGESDEETEASSEPADAGGAQAAASDTGNASDSSNATDTGCATGERSIVDVHGREITLPATVSSVACPGLSSTRMVIYAGALDRITGVTENEKGLAVEGEVVLAAACADVYREAFQDLHIIGTGWPNGEIFHEELITLSPDAVVYFTADASAVDTLQEKTGIPVIGVYATDFGSADFAETMRLLGEVFGTQEQTDALLSYVEESIAELDTRTKDIPEEEKPGVYYGAVSFRGWNGIDATYAHYNPFESIHAKNVADETDGDGAMIVEKEQITKWDPEIMFINQETQTLQILQTDFEANPSFYRELSAVQNGRVYGQLAYNAVATNIELSLINAWYAGSVIFPERFADVDFPEKEKEILRMFLGEQGEVYPDMLKEAGLGCHPVTMFE